MAIKRAPSILAIGVFVVVVALSVVAWWLLHGSVDRQDDALLKEETSHAVLLLQRKVQNTSLLLGSVGVGATVFDANAKALQTQPGITVILVTKGRADPSTGNVTPGPPEVALVVGPMLQPGEQLTGDLKHLALAARSTLSASPVIHLAGNPYVVFSIVPPAIGLPGYVALELMPINPGHASAINGPFHQLDIALYATSAARPSELIASTIGRSPLPHPRTSTELRVGSLRWDAVAAANTPLLDSRVQATPWIILGVGLLLAVGLALTVEALVRRQREQRAISETLQAALLPETLPQPEAAETAVRYVPGVEGSTSAATGTTSSPSTTPAYSQW
jgi:hypothetical protein